MIGGDADADEATNSKDKDETMDLESLREKLLAQVQKHPFWSNKAAKRMQIKNVKRRNVYIYELESYCERRDLEWNFEPYRGGLSTIGSVTPYRSYELPAAPASASALSVSLSQPATPMNHAFTYTSGGGDTGIGIGTSTSQHHHPIAIATTSASASTTTQIDSAKSAKSPAVIRSLSNEVPPTSGSHNYNHNNSKQQLSASRNKLIYESTSSRLEQLIPSPDYLWSIDVMMGGGQPRGRRPLTTPSCVSSEIPNSSFVKRCHGCQGRGKLKCNLCHGVGYEVCLSCSGKGSTRSYSASSSARGYSRSCDRSSSSGNYDRGAGSDSDPYYGGFGGGLGAGATDGNSRNSRYADGGDQSSSSFGNSLSGWFQESCSTCHGSGQKRCWVCAGKSYNNCPGCAGLGSLRCFLKLTVSWLSHCDDVIINNSDQIIPKERLRVCSGLLLVDQVEDRLKPLNLVSETSSQQQQQPQQQRRPDSSQRAEAEQLQLASKQMLDKHRNAYKNEKFLKQRHKVTQIECHIVSYEWKQRHGQFVIYGEERKVYIGKYPFKSFCNLI